MPAGIEIRPSEPADTAAIERLYQAAFPDEDLVALVKSLLDVADVALSLVATVDGTVTGHVIFTRSEVAGSGAAAALLGPLAVAPAQQRRGIGRTLVEAGFERLSAGDTAVVLVLGDPAYYGRLGFAAERRITPPYPLTPEWEEAWQSRQLGNGTSVPATGELQVPRQWRQPALWLP